MAFLKLYRKPLQENYNRLNKLFADHNIEWGVVTKLLCGNKTFIQEVIALGVTQMHDTRTSNLKVIKQLLPNSQTVYIRPPSRRNVANVIKYADVSFNTGLPTIKILSEEAVKQKKHHKIIIMIEMGDLREGVMGDDLVEFYSKIFELPNISIVGVGTNFNCLNGIMPSQDKLIQLSLYKQLIEAKFDHQIPWVCGGTSVAVPMLINNQLPGSVNHFRVGEALFFGNDLFTGSTMKGMRTDVFRLYTEIIELYEKPKVPTGEQTANVAGVIPKFSESDYGKTSYRAILDIGLLDCDPKYLDVEDKDISIIEASSDMLVLDLSDNKANYKIGDLVSFRLRYMGALGIMNSKYIDKVVE